MLENRRGAPEKASVEATSQACDYCGVRSSLVDQFQRWPTGLVTRGMVCPRCRAYGPPSRRRLQAGTLLYAAAVVGLGAWLGGPRLALVWGLGGVALPIALIVVHEMVHGLAARLLGATVFEVRLGWRQPRLQFRLRGTRFTLARGVLRGGYCVAAFLRPKPAAWRFAIVYGAPMALHAAAVAFAAPHLGLPRTPSPWGLLHFFALWNALLFLSSARLLDYPAGAYRLPSDGKALAMLWRRPEVATEWWRPGFVLPAIYATSKEDALARARDVEHMFPADPAVGRALFTVYWALGYHAYALRFVDDYVAGVRQPEGLEERQLLALGALRGDRLRRWLFITVCLHGEAWTAAVDEVNRQLAEEPYAEGRALWLALRAYVLLLRAASPDDAGQAHDDARQAYALLPWVPFVATAWGAAQIEQGRVVEGLACLDGADRLDASRQDTGSRNAWRALAHARLGDSLRARASLREAQAKGLEVGPPSSLLRRAEAALDG